MYLRYEIKSSSSSNTNGYNYVTLFLKDTEHKKTICLNEQLIEKNYANKNLSLHMQMKHQQNQQQQQHLVESVCNNNNNNNNKRNNSNSSTMELNKNKNNNNIISGGGDGGSLLSHFDKQQLIEEISKKKICESIKEEILRENENEKAEREKLKQVDNLYIYNTREAPFESIKKSRMQLVDLTISSYKWL